MNKIFKYFVTGNHDDVVVRISWFVNNFDNEELYSGIEKLFFHFLQYCDKLGIKGEKKFLELFLKIDGRVVIKTNNIKLDTLVKFDYNEPASFEEAYKVIYSTACEQHDLFMQQDIGEFDFKTAMYTYMQEHSKQDTMELLRNGFNRLTIEQSTTNILDKMYTRLYDISTYYDNEKLNELDFMTGNLSKRNNSMELLFSANVPCIDGDTQGVYSGELMHLVGPPGSGKSRFTFIHFCYMAAVVNKIGVLIDSLELNETEVRNILIAYHIIRLFRGTVKIPDSLITKGRLTDEQMQYVKAAEHDLFDSGKYARIIISHKPLYLNDMYKKRFDFFKRNKDIRMWIVDYIGYISYKVSEYGKAKDTPTIIDEADKIGARLVDDAKIGACFICQYNNFGVSHSERGENIEVSDIQGGQAVGRDTDYLIAITRTPEQKLANMISLSTVKQRLGSGFYNVQFGIDLSVSIFKQVVKGG